MKTNPLTSKFANLLRFIDKHRVFFILVFFLLAFLLAFLNACKSPAILTNANDHNSRDSNYHSNYQLIETHDTIIIGLPSQDGYLSPSLCREGRGGSFVCRISDRTRTIHDTTFLLRTDTLLRTQTITQTERYIPPFYKFCTIAFVTFVAFVTLKFSIHLLLRYLKIRSPT